MLAMIERISPYFDRLIEAPFVYYAMGTVVVLVLILFAIQRYRAAHRPIIPFKAEGGSVEIAPKTIRGLINTTVRSVPGVRSASCSYRQRGRKLRLKVDIHLNAASKLNDVQSEIKKRVRASLNTHIGIETKDVDPVRIKVTKLVGEPDIHSIPSAPERYAPEPTPYPSPVRPLVPEDEDENEVEESKK